MSARQAKLIILCEDSQHEAFVRRFLVATGWDKRSLRVEKSPQGRGSGEQWVRERFPVELSAMRSRHVLTKLVVVIDADTHTVSQVHSSLNKACGAASVDPRRADDSVAFIIPRRNIETWITYLQGQEVKEEEAYAKLARERDCAPAVRALKEMCVGGSLRTPFPDSLVAACGEYNTRVKGL